MAELAIRVAVEMKTNSGDKQKDQIEVGVTAVATGGEKFLIEDVGSDWRLPGRVAVHVFFKDEGRDITEDPKIKEGSIAAPVAESSSLGIYTEKITEEENIIPETRALFESANDEIVVTLVGKRAIAIALRELEYLSHGFTRLQAQAVYIRKAIGLALNQLGEEAKEAVAELMIEFLGQNYHGGEKPDGVLAGTSDGGRDQTHPDFGE